MSYPRTDSSYLTLDLYNEITEHIKSCNFGKFAAAIEKIDLTSIRADKSYFNDAKVTDHHALIPTINDTTKDKYDSLSVDEKTYLMRLCIDSWLFFIRRMNTEALRWLHELMIFTFAAVEYQ